MSLVRSRRVDDDSAGSRKNPAVDSRADQIDRGPLCVQLGTR